MALALHNLLRKSPAAKFISALQNHEPRIPPHLLFSISPFSSNPPIQDRFGLDAKQRPIPNSREFIPAYMGFTSTPICSTGSVPSKTVDAIAGQCGRICEEEEKEKDEQAQLQDAEEASQGAQTLDQLRRKEDDCRSATVPYPMEAPRIYVVNFIKADIVRS
ncbi:hypothetical protein I3842_04G031200 [Carya illinoinensis]|uniref:Uncharacterized protein n=1 Tax=Carya illinoinensis TaxID=32201 RepID=A0A922FA48_CARIL|nr:hypothetical protein I3842_04G031200 [Carya illinoinensis]